MSLPALLEQRLRLPVVAAPMFLISNPQLVLACCSNGVVGSFPDGNSALMLVCARLRHVAGSQWGNKKYMNMKHLEAAIEDASIAG